MAETQDDSSNDQETNRYHFRKRLAAQLDAMKPERKRKRRVKRSVLVAPDAYQADNPEGEDNAEACDFVIMDEAFEQQGDDDYCDYFEEVQMSPLSTDGNMTEEYDPLSCVGNPFPDDVFNDEQPLTDNMQDFMEPIVASNMQTHKMLSTNKEPGNFYVKKEYFNESGVGENMFNSIDSIPKIINGSSSFKPTNIKAESGIKLEENDVVNNCGVIKIAEDLWDNEPSEHDRDTFESDDGNLLTSTISIKNEDFDFGSPDNELNSSNYISDSNPLPIVNLPEDTTNNSLLCANKTNSTLNNGSSQIFSTQNTGSSFTLAQPCLNDGVMNQVSLPSGTYILMNSDGNAASTNIIQQQPLDPQAQNLNVFCNNIGQTVVMENGSRTFLLINKSNSVQVPKLLQSKKKLKVISTKVCNTNVEIASPSVPSLRKYCGVRRKPKLSVPSILVKRNLENPKFYTNNKNTNTLLPKIDLPIIVNNEKLINFNDTNEEINNIIHSDDKSVQGGNSRSLCSSDIVQHTELQTNIVVHESPPLLNNPDILATGKIGVKKLNSMQTIVPDTKESVVQLAKEPIKPQAEKNILLSGETIVPHSEVLLGLHSEEIDEPYSDKIFVPHTEETIVPHSEDCFIFDTNFKPPVSAVMSVKKSRKQTFKPRIENSDDGRIFKPEIKKSDYKTFLQMKTENHSLTTKNYAVTCNECKGTFLNESSYEQHKHMYDNQTNCCKFCEEQCVNRCQLRLHLSAHSDQYCVLTHENFQLGKCNLLSYIDLVDIGPFKGFVCYCTKNFKYKKTLYKHVKKFYEKCKLNCMTSSFNISNKKVRRKCRSRFNNACIEQGEVIKKYTTPNCKICKLEFENRYVYLEHVRFDHVQNYFNYFCEHCNFKGGSGENKKNAIEKHMYIHLQNGDI